MFEHAQTGEWADAATAVCARRKGPETGTLMRRAWRLSTCIPAFNIPYLPMMEPVVRALRDANSFGLVMVARLEWEKFQSGSLEAIRDEYKRVKDPRHTRLHLDHVPVIDEENVRVDYEEIIGRALTAGYESVMVDASRLPLTENIACTRRVVDLAHGAGVPVEAELGAILGHEAGPLPPYDEMFASGRGFTDPEEARLFVRETGVDWLSVAIGNVHGAIASAARVQKKVEARLSIERLREIRDATEIPLVLHGGTGIPPSYLLDAVRHGISKINVATAIRQPYERCCDQSIEEAQEAVYREALRLLREDLQLTGSATRLVSVAQTA
jgi:fructose-bisphosphate aldolase class II